MNTLTLAQVVDRFTLQRFGTTPKPQREQIAQLVLKAAQTAGINGLDAEQYDALCRQQLGISTLPLSAKAQPVDLEDLSRDILPLRKDFSGQVAPRSEDWQASNEKKVVHFVSNLSGLNPGQRLYLTALLFAYMRNVGRHSLSGSIVDLAYEAESQTFKIRVVDTCCFEYNPRTDYGQRMKQYEINLGALEKHFGFMEMVRVNQADLGLLEAFHNPQSRLALPNMVILLLAARSHPERVAVFEPNLFSEHRLYVFNQAVTNSTKGAHILAELGLEDFNLDPWEKQAIAIREILTCIKNTVLELRLQLDILNHTTGRIKGFILEFTKEGDDRRALADSIEESRFVLNALEDNFYANVRKEILLARGRLEYLGQDTRSTLMASLNETLKELNGMVVLAGKVFGADYVADLATVLAEINTGKDQMVINDNPATP